jgi:hypothetical protein
MTAASLLRRISRARDGGLRLKLKRGRLSGYGEGAHAHLFDAAGRRVDTGGEAGLEIGGPCLRDHQL